MDNEIEPGIAKRATGMSISQRTTEHPTRKNTGEYIKLPKDPYVYVHTSWSLSTPDTETVAELA